MTELAVFRCLPAGVVRVGKLLWADGQAPCFCYDHDYLGTPQATPLSVALPLSEQAYGEERMRPYFEGLLPEGRARTALAHVSGGEPWYLRLLAQGALDCAGDVMVLSAEEAEGLLDVPAEAFVSPEAFEHGGVAEPAYERLAAQDLRELLADLSSLAEGCRSSGVVLAGARGKVGLAHGPAGPVTDGWLRPLGGASSTHVLKTGGPARVSEYELLCMEAAQACGLLTVPVNAFYLGAPVLVSERFDRRVRERDGRLRVERLAQEDLSQALGVSARSKRQELEGGTYHAVAQLLYERSSRAAVDVERLARRAVIEYLLGDCANHLRKLAVVHEGRWLRLAPAYGLVSTTPFRRFSREMARRIGSTRVIDHVQPHDFELLARDLGLGVKRMRRICAELAGAVVPAVREAGERHAATLLTLPYAAEDLIADMGPRVTVAQAAAQGL